MSTKKKAAVVKAITEKRGQLLLDRQFIFQFTGGVLGGSRYRRCGH